MAYNGFLPENVINIGKIYSIHYFEYMSDFSFEGESHDFWEFICVDKGEVEVTGGDKKFILHKGEIAFHEPNEFHNVTATGTIAPNLIVISFQCDDNAIYYFRKKILKVMRNGSDLELVICSWSFLKKMKKLLMYLNCWKTVIMIYSYNRHEPTCKVCQSNTLAYIPQLLHVAFRKE